MKKKKIILVSSITTYMIDIDCLSENLFTVTVKYVLNNHIINNPLLYYRVTSYEVADIYYNKIINIIKTNEENLCVKKMKNWLFNTHIIRYLMQTQN